MKKKKEFKIPIGLKYTKLHEWLKIEGNIFTLGITDFAQYQIGDINTIPEFPRVGTEVEPLLESEYEFTIKREGKTSTGYVPGKTVALMDCSKGDFFAYSSVRGKIVEVNEPLSGKDENGNVVIFDAGKVVNEDPYGQGWLVRIEIIDPGPLENLLDAEGYKKFIRGE